jgi:hypothetical protein
VHDLGFAGCPLWVKTGNALIERSTSGLPPKTRHPRVDEHMGGWDQAASRRARCKDSRGRPDGSAPTAAAQAVVFACFTSSRSFAGVSAAYRRFAHS